MNPLSQGTPHPMPEAVRPPSQVDDAHSDLFDAIVRLEELGEQLEHRMARVLRPADPGSDIAKAPDLAPTGVPVADEIHGAAVRVRQANNRIAGLLSRSAL